jgi:hypothetical protein
MNMRPLYQSQAIQPETSPDYVRKTLDSSPINATVPPLARCLDPRMALGNPCGLGQLLKHARQKSIANTRCESAVSGILHEKTFLAKHADDLYRQPSRINEGVC